MREIRRWRLVGTVAFVLLHAAATAFAQATTSGAIAGTVKDGSGAVLPGATIEASSPALIEKVRSVVSDGSGEFKIIELRPGIYTVMVTLPGFGTYKREGVQLSAGFTATVDASLKVGSVEETITVTGASPVVDVQNTRGQYVLTAETLDTLPSGNRNPSAIGALTLGATFGFASRHDVGGDKGDANAAIIIHGSRGEDNRTYWDGNYINTFVGNGGGGSRVYYPNMTAIQEVVIETAANSVESETGGANVNLIPREGSNSFKFYSFGTAASTKLAAAAVPANILARGAGPTLGFKEIYELGIGLGGPILTDRLWFYSSNRWWGAQSILSNNYFNKSTNPLFYVPDLTRPNYSASYYRDNGGRITWQAAKAHKIGLDIHNEDGCNCRSGQNSAPESGQDSVGHVINVMPSWNYIATSRLLVQAGVTYSLQRPTFMSGVADNHSWFTGRGTPFFPGPDVHAITELTGVPGGAPAGYTYGTLPGNTAGIFCLNCIADSHTERFSMSYVTGSHAFKAGVQLGQGVYDFTAMDSTPAAGYAYNMVNYTFSGGKPLSLREWAGPLVTKGKLGGQAVYVQDLWTLRRLTINGGLRFDHTEAHSPVVNAAAGPFVPARSYAEQKNLPNYKDVSPRLGAAYDFFGNGKTALKVSFGRYLFGQGFALIASASPSASVVTSVTRNWNDSLFGAGDPRTGNFVPDCDLTNPALNGECGVINNAAFGLPISNTSLADDARQGWGTRQYSYESSVQLQHELRSGVGMSVGYFRTSFANQTVIQNTAVLPSDFTQFCITAPTDPRLSQYSGQQICGLYDVNQNQFGKVNNVVTLAKNFGNPGEVFNGVDVGLNARWGQGALLTGGVTFGRQTIDYCYANNRPDLTPQGFPGPLYPRNAAYCKATSPWLDGIGSQVKFQFVYPLPGDFQVSGAYKSLPGIPLQANLVVSNAVASPALGRNISSCPATGACTATLSVPIIGYGGTSSQSGVTAGTVFDIRLNQTDVRLAKIFKTGSRRFTVNADLYNAFNTRAPQANITTYGASWLTPTQLLGGRLLKFSGEVKF